MTTSTAVCLLLLFYILIHMLQKTKKHVLIKSCQIANQSVINKSIISE